MFLSWEKSGREGWRDHYLRRSSYLACWLGFQTCGYPLMLYFFFIVLWKRNSSIFLLSFYLCQWRTRIQLVDIVTALALWTTTRGGFYWYNLWLVEQRREEIKRVKLETLSLNSTLANAFSKGMTRNNIRLQTCQLSPYLT